MLCANTSRPEWTTQATPSRLPRKSGVKHSTSSSGFLMPTKTKQTWLYILLATLTNTQTLAQGRTKTQTACNRQPHLLFSSRTVSAKCAAPPSGMSAEGGEEDKNNQRGAIQVQATKLNAYWAPIKSKDQAHCQCCAYRHDQPTSRQCSQRPTRWLLLLCSLAH